MKFALMDIAAAIAVNSVAAKGPFSNRWSLFPHPTIDQLSSNTIINPKHIYLGGWLNCELSASYHNRRLVAWEPFIEPWIFESVFGSDLVRSMKLRPLTDRTTPLWTPKDDSQETPRRPQLDITGGGRLRDFGRLLRSPFQSDPKSEKSDNNDLIDILYTDIDFCYLAIVASAKTTLDSASYLDRPLQPSILPGENPFHWLNHFGYPSNNDQEEEGNLSHPAITCRLSDSKTLNINVTGALIEDVSEYLKKRETAKLHRLAPHWIRNESGLVSSIHVPIESWSFDTIH